MPGMLDPGWRVGETPNTPVRLEDVVNHIGHTCQLSGNARHAAPAVLAKTRRENPDRARAIQADLSAQFLEHFNHGLTVVGFEKADTFGAYLLGGYK